ncbi:hypothetical protein SAMN04487905_11140 [Actinopolyspora xinjiangensis]|uniref:Uncharacterized protein n=1 Tax=Actinopolyspora xinjiangensis TaxID=405564 RepID=A0A1H0W875_9ACTN|nr:hypothetical protein [Actinopolyspora xinjiangensis]SDP86950.1 hypothetical protein SAMN04487905_11140 [Actinopolyspora xinjiangensis]
MSRDSGSGDPSQRTVAELLAEHGGGGQRGSRRRRRRAEDPSETAPQAIIERVNSDSGRMLPVEPAETEEAASSGDGTASGSGATALPGAASTPPAVAPSESPTSQPPQPPTTGSPVEQPTSPPTTTPPRRRVSGAGPRRPDSFGAGAAETGARQAPDEEPGQWSTPASGEQPAVPAAEQDVTASAAPPAVPGPSAAANSAPAAEDAETTAQHPALPVRVPGTSGMSRKDTPPPEVETAQWQGPPSRTSARDAPVPDASDSEDSAPATVPEDATERFPPVGGRVTGDPEVTDGDGTALLEYPIPAGTEPADSEESEPGAAVPSGSRGPAHYDPYEEVGAGLGDSDEFYTGMVDDPYAESEDYDEAPNGHVSDQPPTGLRVEDDEDEPESAELGRSSVKEWAILVAQTLGGLLGGGLVWMGFRWLWSGFPLPALAAALAFTGALVLVARKVLRTDDLQTILLSVLVGLVCTVSPVAFLLVGY